MINKLSLKALLYIKFINLLKFDYKIIMKPSLVKV